MQLQFLFFLSSKIISLSSLSVVASKKEPSEDQAWVSSTQKNVKLSQESERDPSPSHVIQVRTNATFFDSHKKTSYMNREIKKKI